MPLALPPNTADYSDRSPATSNRQIVLLLGFVIGLVLVIFTSVEVMAGVLAGMVPYSVEQQLGALMVPVFEQMAEPSETQDQLNALLDQLESQLPERDRDYELLYVPDATVNAMALPGHHIVLYQGLLAEVESENELMMVLGHELGHFAHRDHMRQLGRGLLMQIVWSSLLGDMGGLQSVAASGVSALSDARYSQRQEYQADEFGLKLLQKTYGQAAGATDFFRRMSQKPEAQLQSWDFLATHPGSAQRVKQLERQIAARSYPIGQKTPLSPELKVIRP
ncbi:MAG: M48 family metallopeptidase [Elainella sp.]